MSDEIQKVPYPSHPNRCQMVSPATGQCLNMSMDQQQYCKAHISARAQQISNQTKRVYNLMMFQERMKELTGVEDEKNLSEELALLRITLEGIMNHTGGDSNQLLIHSSKINDTTTRILKMVQAIHNIQKTSGTLLDKNAIVQLAGNIINIITKHVDDPNTVALIANDILEEVKKASPQKDE
jgi:hypothetical protein